MSLPLISFWNCLNIYLAIFSEDGFSLSNGWISFRYLWSSLLRIFSNVLFKILKSTPSPILFSFLLATVTSTFQLWPCRFSHSPSYWRRLCAAAKSDITVSSYINNSYTSYLEGIYFLYLTFKMLQNNSLNLFGQINSFLGVFFRYVIINLTWISDFHTITGQNFYITQFRFNGWDNTFTEQNKVFKRMGFRKIYLMKCEKPF